MSETPLSIPYHNLTDETSPAHLFKTSTSKSNFADAFNIIVAYGRDGHLVVRVCVEDGSCKSYLFKSCVPVDIKFEKDPKAPKWYDISIMNNVVELSHDKIKHVIPMNPPDCK